MSNSAKALNHNKIRPHSQKRSLPKNYSNANFHSAVDLAKFYSGYIFL